MKTLKCKLWDESGEVEAYVSNTKIRRGDTFRVLGAGRFDGVYTVSTIESSVPYCECCPFLSDSFEYVGTSKLRYCTMRRRTGSRDVGICLSDARSSWYMKITSLDKVMEGL